MQNTQYPPSLPQNINLFAQTSAPPSTCYNSHYLQAYTHAQPLSSHDLSALTISNANASQTRVEKTYTSRNPAARPFQPFSSSWYQPGNQHCTYQGCSFTGSHKTVEVHMMDRHLIYPPGWDTQKKKQDWDADPSLKGKTIPIRGTNVTLDSPEVLAAWIAERKRRFPTSARVKEKKCKMEEAVARGQLHPVDLGHRARKRRKTDNHAPSEFSKGRCSRREQRGSSSEKRTELVRVSDTGWGGRMRIKDPQLVEATAEHDLPGPSSPRERDSEEDNDASPEIISSKTIPPMELTVDTKRDVEMEEVMKMSSVEKPATEIRQIRRKPLPMQPKMPPRNPFAAQSTLLRNLLLPEIRMTVSNLSQAIRFLVDNDFLQDVESKPGEAIQRNIIEVMTPPQDTGN
ncbi:hypothetical protein BDN70DRAFT_886166, partial [Pholiota conissans]